VNEWGRIPVGIDATPLLVQCTWRDSSHQRAFACDNFNPGHGYFTKDIWAPDDPTGQAWFHTKKGLKIVYFGHINFSDAIWDGISPRWVYLVQVGFTGTPERGQPQVIIPAEFTTDTYPYF